MSDGHTDTPFIIFELLLGIYDMVQINFARREVNCKIVYYGPGLSGKTTNLEKVHEQVPRDRCGKLTSIATEGDRTLFFDFMPLHIGKVAGMDTKFQLYTVPGQTFYESTRRLVLQGADGVVFVADSQKDKFDENLESFENLRRNLKENGLNVEEMPVVIQYNKRDLPDTADVQAMNAALNTGGWPHFEAVAVEGRGVMPTLKAVSAMVLETLNTRHRKTRRPSRTTTVETPARKTTARRTVKAGSGLIGASATAPHPGPPTATVSRPSPRAGIGDRRRSSDTRWVRSSQPAPAQRSAVSLPEQPRAKNANKIWLAVGVAVGAAAAVSGLLLFLL